MNTTFKSVLGAAQPSRELVRLVGVQKHYGSGLDSVHALHDITLQVNAGEMVAVCGPSGNGKTTLLNVIGMIDSASEGSVQVSNLLVAKLSEQARADLRCEVIGHVFQSFSLIPVMNALDNVMLPLVLRGRMSTCEHAAAQARAAELLGQLGLSTQAAQFPARLDDSQRQRVAIARALVGRPRLVLADEPTSRLDHGAIRQVMELFARQQRQHGTAFVITTRDQRQLHRATRTLQLSEGRLHGAPLHLPRKALHVQL